MEKNIQLAIKESKIDSAFNRNAVKMSTSIKDEDITPFMEEYRPTFEQVQS
jgi:predicted lipoprotein